MDIKDFITKINNVVSRMDFEKYFNWFIQKFTLTDKSAQLNNKKKNGIHPLRPRKGEIYLIDFGQNVGTELSNTHMGIIVQDSLRNSVSSTVVVIPISSSLKLYDTHEKITKDDISQGQLNKLPSKAKAEQITCIDKARLIHKIGELTSDFMKRLEKRILKNLNIN